MPEHDVVESAINEHIFGGSGAGAASVVTCTRSYKDLRHGGTIERGTVAEVRFEGQGDLGEGPEAIVRLMVKSVPGVEPGKWTIPTVFEMRRGTFTAWWK